ncbi:type 11 methyltransferase [Cylindrospermum sp. NIES-4074]|nr:type 11 methyltransferase [Cylindrospermum sp. NIES-4074]
MINTSEKHKCDRQFRWISSVDGDPKIIENLNQKMAWFYGKQDGRQLYQTMLNSQEETIPDDNSVRHLMPKYVCDLEPENILEIGCDFGRLYRQLRSYGYKGHYSGLEVAQHIIEYNTKEHPEATWKCALAYNIPWTDHSFDVCFSLYVLEHFVYPEKALCEMLRVLKKDGRLVLVFPDFVKSGRFPSQKTGCSEIGRASEKLRSGKIIDAVISLYDSRIRLPAALKTATTTFGAFPINTQPICLSYPLLMGADIDAIYIASKQEIHDWAVSKGYQVEYPCGIDGDFAEQAFMVILK